MIGWFFIVDHIYGCRMKRNVLRHRVWLQKRAVTVWLGSEGSRPLTLQCSVTLRNRSVICIVQQSKFRVLRV